MSFNFRDMIHSDCLLAYLPVKTHIQQSTASTLIVSLIFHFKVNSAVTTAKTIVKIPRESAARLIDFLGSLFLKERGN